MFDILFLLILIPCDVILSIRFNSSPPELNFTGNIFKSILMKETFCIWHEFHLSVFLRVQLTVIILVVTWRPNRWQAITRISADLVHWWICATRGRIMVKCWGLGTKQFVSSSKECSWLNKYRERCIKVTSLYIMTVDLSKPVDIANWLDHENQNYNKNSKS